MTNQEWKKNTRNRFNYSSLKTKAQWRKISLLIKRMEALWIRPHQFKDEKTRKLEREMITFHVTTRQLRCCSKRIGSSWQKIALRRIRPNFVWNWRNICTRLNGSIRIGELNDHRLLNFSLLARVRKMSKTFQTFEHGFSMRHNLKQTVTVETVTKA